tara:strand:- start:1885 stop:3282 length:1398 start_codon:yes stop_codon:yes gene_type:complete
MKLKLLFRTALLSLVFIFLSCSQEDSILEDAFVVAFEVPSINLLEMADEESIGLVYSKVSTFSGAININIISSDLVYGVDFITIPEASNNELVLPVILGEFNNAFILKRLSNNFDEDTEIIFNIIDIDYLDSNIQGNSTIILNSSASLGGSLEPEVGGPNQGNQVFIDLSTGNATKVQRDSWDLGFYNGEQFRVTINGSIYMATRALSETNIDAVSQSDVSNLQPQVAVGTFNPSNADYIDAPNGNILETAIDEISENDAENPVYLLNLGYEIGTNTPTLGSVGIAGDQRGWKKIRILRNDNGYILQYANLEDTSHQSITIEKNSDYNFVHFSFNTNTLVSVEPQKDKWDISFTVFTNVISGAGSYGFSDFVTHNNKGNALAYRVNTSNFEYDEFELTNIVTSNFSENQTTIGSSWRDVFNGTPFNDRFYVIKDPNGTIYKLKFLALTNNNGERGYPEFEYELLQ